MTSLDLSTLSDEELETLGNGVLNEQERRQNLANIPAQIEGLRQKFIDGGGDPADLNVDSLTEKE